MAFASRSSQLEGRRSIDDRQIQSKFANERREGSVPSMMRTVSYRSGFARTWSRASQITKKFLWVRVALFVSIAI
jgi:hypothetical protein